MFWRNIKTFHTCYGLRRTYSRYILHTSNLHTRNDDTIKVHDDIISCGAHYANDQRGKRGNLLLWTCDIIFKELSFLHLNCALDKAECLVTSIPHNQCRRDIAFDHIERRTTHISNPHSIPQCLTSMFSFNFVARCISNSIKLHRFSSTTEEIAFSASGKTFNLRWIWVRIQYGHFQLKPINCVHLCI